MKNIVLTFLSGKDDTIEIDLLKENISLVGVHNIILNSGFKCVNMNHHSDALCENITFSYLDIEYKKT